MLGQVLKFGSSLDWITPTIALLNDFRNGPVVVFFVPFGIGWSATDIKRMLESKGVRVWGLMIANDEIKFRVRDAQARYTAYWLERHRLPFQSSMATARSTGTRGKARASASNDPSTATGDSKRAEGDKNGGVFDRVLDGIDAITEKL